MSTPPPYRLINNSRFYILVTAVALSLVLTGWVRLTVSGDELYVIRLQQWFGLCCLLFLYSVLLITPLGYVLKAEWLKLLKFSRRGLGVAAAYFAALHAGVSLAGQLGGFEQLRYLPPVFIWSLLAGTGAVLVLLVMAAASFDAVIRAMTFPRWKWLQRGVYVAGVLIIVHVWSIGTHLAYGWVQWLAFAALTVLFGLECYRATVLFTRTRPAFAGREYFTTIFLSSWALLIVLLLSVPLLVQNYHSAHETAPTAEAAP